MNEKELNAIATWFDGFVASFQAGSSEEQRNYDLKIEHTRRVMGFMERLTASMDIPSGERALASAIALCHDVGRFPQYRDYGTFNDSLSTNHASLAVKVLKRQGVLDNLAAESRSLLLQAVALHNAFIIPNDLDPELRHLTLLIRDADKLDIWRVMIEYFTATPGERAAAVAWGLPETGACSERAIAEVAAGRMLCRSLLESADDFKLLQLSWVFDLNFAESFAIMDELGYLETIASLLPQQQSCQEAVETVRSFARSRVLSSA